MYTRCSCTAVRYSASNGDGGILPLSSVSHKMLGRFVWVCPGPPTRVTAPRTLFYVSWLEHLIVCSGHVTKEVMAILHCTENLWSIGTTSSHVRCHIMHCIFHWKRLLAFSRCWQRVDSTSDDIVYCFVVLAKLYKCSEKHLDTFFKLKFRRRNKGYQLALVADIHPSDDVPSERSDSGKSFLSCS